ncbi:hypothetical protein CAP36_00520 [Chitinophagaceae bacterium IBVUCB2]|nr:hypothetical protein CAP36_00520 [Chitinophagaceae bacterium IBVUCB2]
MNWLILIIQSINNCHLFLASIATILCQQKNNYMETTIKHVYAPTAVKQKSGTSLWKRFINWADKQEENRFGWTAFSIAGHGCVFTVITVAMILFTGNNFMLWPFAIGAMAICLVANLAALPTKITIPILFFSVLIDLVIIGICLSYGFDMAASYR